MMKIVLKAINSTGKHLRLNEQEINQIKRSVIDNSLKKQKLVDQIQSMDDYNCLMRNKIKINFYFKDLNENLSNTQTIDSISVTLNRFEGKQFPEHTISNRNKEIEVIHNIC